MNLLKVMLEKCLDYNQTRIWVFRINNWKKESLRIKHNRIFQRKCLIKGLWETREFLKILKRFWKHKPVNDYLWTSNLKKGCLLLCSFFFFKCALSPPYLIYSLLLLRISMELQFTKFKLEITSF